MRHNHSCLMIRCGFNFAFGGSSLKNRPGRHERGHVHVDAQRAAHVQQAAHVLEGLRYATCIMKTESRKIRNRILPRRTMTAKLRRRRTTLDTTIWHLVFYTRIYVDGGQGNEFELKVSGWLKATNLRHMVKVPVEDPCNGCRASLSPGF